MAGLDPRAAEMSPPVDEVKIAPSAKSHPILKTPNGTSETVVDSWEGDVVVTSALAAPSTNGCAVDELEVPSDDEDEEEDWLSVSDVSQSDSICHMILNADPDEELVEGPIVDKVTPDEAKAYRARLREIGPEKFVQETLTSNTITAKMLLTAFDVRLPDFLEGKPDSSYYRLLGLALVRELTTRKKLPQYNTFEDVVRLLKQSQKVIVITGAGISTNLGIPDFRSKDTGFYAKMREKGFASGEDVFSLEYFEDDPSIFYSNCGDTFPVAGMTTPTHAFIEMLQRRDKLLTNYTQNIDNIEETAGIRPEKLIQCHGSWATATCRKCGYKVSGRDILDEVRAGTVPRCSRCKQNLAIVRPTLKRKRSSLNGMSKSRKDFEDDSASDGEYDIPEPGVMKPDITFFGEALPPAFFQRFAEHDRENVDLLIVIGTSMKVAPVSEIPNALDPDIPQIFISRDPCHHIAFDVTLLGDCDLVTSELAKRAGFPLSHNMLKPEQEVDVIASGRDGCAWSIMPRSEEAALAGTRE